MTTASMSRSAALVPVPPRESVPTRTMAKLEADFYELVEALGEPVWRGDGDFPGDEAHQRLSWRYRDGQHGAVICVWDWDAPTASATANTSWHVGWQDGAAGDGAGRRLFERVKSVIAAIRRDARESQSSIVQSTESRRPQRDADGGDSDPAKEAATRTAESRVQAAKPKKKRRKHPAASANATAAASSPEPSGDQTPAQAAGGGESHQSADWLTSKTPGDWDFSRSAAAAAAEEVPAEQLELIKGPAARDSKRAASARATPAQAAAAAKLAQTQQAAGQSADRATQITEEYAQRMKQEMENLRGELARTGQLDTGKMRDDMLQYCAEKVVKDLSAKHRVGRDDVVRILNRAFGRK